MMKRESTVSFSGCHSDSPDNAVCPAGYVSCSYKQNHPWGEFGKQLVYKGDLLPGAAQKAHRILFLIRGSMHIRIDGQDNYYLRDKQCMFLSKDKDAAACALADSEVCLLDFTNRMIFCNNDVLTTVVANGQEPWNGSPVLPVDPKIESFLAGLDPEMIDLHAACYHSVKEHELCLLMWHVYGVRRLGCFFRDILQPKDDFYLFIMSSYRKTGNIAAMSRLANLSESSFVRRFRETFHDRFHAWRVKQISADLVQTIRSGIVEKEDLMELFQFRTYPSFYRFCTRHIHCSPTELIDKYRPKNKQFSPLAEDERKEVCV